MEREARAAPRVAIVAGPKRRERDCERAHHCPEEDTNPEEERFDHEFPALRRLCRHQPGVGPLRPSYEPDVAAV
jgi:hypothetical protein